MRSSCSQLGPAYAQCKSVKQLDGCGHAEHAGPSADLQEGTGKYSAGQGQNHPTSHQALQTHTGLARLRYHEQLDQCLLRSIQAQLTDMHSVQTGTKQ